MNLIPMLAWWQWLIMVAVPPLIVMLYFLKLRRQPVQVPSTYLWKRTVEDLHVNSIWQRLRKNLLLLLQLIAAGLLILACLRPGFSGTTTLGNRSVFLIDNSASMQATDIKGSRLRAAKDKVLQMIDAMNSKDAAMVIAFSNVADVRQGFSSDRRRLRDAVESIQPTNRTTDLNEALRAAAGLANPGRTSQLDDLGDIQVAEAMPATLYVVSDGGFVPPPFQMGNLSPKFIPIGSKSVNNVAILAFTAERNLEKPEQVEAFARVRNFGDSPVTVTASLTLNEQLVDASEVKLEANGESGATFQLKDVTEGRLKIELELTDDFSIDNIAYAGLDPPRQLQVVLATPGNTPLETALNTPQAQSVATITTVSPDSLESPDVQQMAASGKIDLFIYDRCAPKAMPLSNTLFMGTVPPLEGWQAAPPAGPVFVIDINRQHPIMQYVNLRSVQIVEGTMLTTPPGATPLLRSDGGVLMAIAPRDAFQDAVLGMGLLRANADGSAAPNTDWYNKPSFPVFLLNSLEYLGGSVTTSGSKTVQPGEPAVLSLASRFDKVKVITPDKSDVLLDRSGTPQLIFNRTDAFGFYQVEPTDAQRTLQLFTVNLFSERESTLTTPEDIMLGEEQIKAVASQESVRREYWRWLLALALVVLTAEWIMYTRRIAV
ncbi:MAG: BatA and WFA domain-containing protein [Pirellulaceae bacterium]|nr:BatA and WFA domain-containing protein [Pirellulaceae bacterium]